MTSRADHIHFAWIDRVSFGCSVYQMATRIAITYGPIPSVSRVRATTIRYTFCSLRDSAFDHRPSPYCPTQLVFFNLPPTIRFPLLAVHPGPSSSHNRFFRSFASQPQCSHPITRALVPRATIVVPRLSVFNNGLVLEKIFFAYEYRFFPFFPESNVRVLYRIQVFVSRTSVSNFLFSSDEPRCFFFYPSFPSRNYSSKFAYVYKRCSLKPRMNLTKVIRGRESKFELSFRSFDYCSSGIFQPRRRLFVKGG